MTNKPQAVEVNCETGETITRDLTAGEIAERDQMAADMAAKKATDDAEAERIAGLKASAKAKLIAGNPLTAEEADTLVL